MGLTVKSLGLYDVPILASDGQRPLDNGVVHVSDTSLGRRPPRETSTSSGTG